MSVFYYKNATILILLTDFFSLVTWGRSFPPSPLCSKMTGTRTVWKKLTHQPACTYFYIKSLWDQKQNQGKLFYITVFCFLVCNPFITTCLAKKKKKKKRATPAWSTSQYVKKRVLTQFAHPTKPVPWLAHLSINDLFFFELYPHQDHYFHTYFFFDYHLPALDTV